MLLQLHMYIITYAGIRAPGERQRHYALGECGSALSNRFHGWHGAQPRICPEDSGCRVQGEVCKVQWFIGSGDEGFERWVHNIGIFFSFEPGWVYILVWLGQKN